MELLEAEPLLTAAEAPTHTSVPTPYDKRLMVFRFFVQAKNYDMAEEELNMMLKDLPDVKERVDKAREELRQLRADQDLQDATVALGARAFTEPRLEAHPAARTPASAGDSKHARQRAS